MSITDLIKKGELLKRMTVATSATVNQSKISSVAKVATVAPLAVNKTLIENYSQRLKSHSVLKKNLGPRIEVLRVLIRRFLSNPSNRRMVNYRVDRLMNDSAIEVYLDNELKNFEYDLEAIIGVYQKCVSPLQSSSTQCALCSYRGVFCGCVK